MFNKLITKLKLKDTKDLKFVLEERFSSVNAVLRSSAKQFKMPTYELPKIKINIRLPTYQPITPLIRQSKLYSGFLSVSRSILTKKTLKTALYTSLGIYFAYQYHPNMTQIKLSYDTNDFNSKLISELTHLKDQHFYPNFICTTALMQCIMNNCRPESNIRYTRDHVALPDGGQVVLDWCLPSKQIELPGNGFHGRYYSYQPAADNKILFIIHGLTGGSETSYIKMLVDTAAKNGYRVVVMNQRGVNQALTSPFPFHGGPNDDVEAAIKVVKQKYPDAPLVAVGTSFGGNQLMRYMGSVEKNPFSAAVMLAAPFDLTDCVDDVENTVYEDFFIKAYLEKNFLPNLDIFQSLQTSHGVDLEQILKVKKLRDYHTHFTAKVFNHKDADDYFLGSKVHEHHIDNINIPLMVLNSKDDPIAVHRSIPIETLKKNPNILYAETNHGGHLCWFTGLFPKRWYSEPTVQFLEKAIELKAQEKKNN